MKKKNKILVPKKNKKTQLRESFTIAISVHYLVDVVGAESSEGGVGDDWARGGNSGAQRFHSQWGSWKGVLCWGSIGLSVKWSWGSIADSWGGVGSLG